MRSDEPKTSVGTRPAAAAVLASSSGSGFHSSAPGWPASLERHLASLRNVLISASTKLDLKTLKGK